MRTRKKLWVLVASHTEARIFEQPSPGAAMVLVHEMTHPEGRLQSRELKEGRPGRSFSSWSGSHSRHAMAPELSPKEQDERQFAHDLSDFLQMGRLQHRFDELVLVAAPHFMGIVSAFLDPPTRRSVRGRVKKDLLGLNSAKLAAYLRQLAV